MVVLSVWGLHGRGAAADSLLGVLDRAVVLLVCAAVVHILAAGFSSCVSN